MKRRRALATAAVGASATLAGCTGAFPSRSTTRTRPRTAPPTAVRGDAAFTYGPASGNRVASGTADLGNAERVDVELSGTLAWVVGASTAATRPDDERESAGTTWVVAHADGTLDAVAIQDGDGRVELVGPTDDRSELAVLARKRDGVRRIDALALPARLAGNLATATVDGTTTLGAITPSGLHVWPA